MGQVRTFIRTRVWADSQEEAEAAFREDAQVHGWIVIKVVCYPTHVPRWWEGSMEVETEEDKVVESLKNQFLREVSECENPTYLIVAVKLPTGATEIIMNTQSIKEKAAYYENAYDENFRLKTNPSISIINYMLV